jgi:sugar fermentation stimulation protein A
MQFPSRLSRGVLVRRYRRFLAEVRLDGGTTVVAHCPSPATLRGCAEPGSTVLLSDSGDSGRRHPLTWEITDLAGTLVCINTPLCRRVMMQAVLDHAIPALATFHEVQREAQSGLRGTVDLLLHGMERNAFVNLYGTTWASEGVALFPDAPAAKAAASIGQLAGIARQGHQAAALFFVQRGDCTLFRPAEDVDRAFTKAILDAQSAGVEMLAYAARVTQEGIALADQLPVSLA